MKTQSRVTLKQMAEIMNRCAKTFRKYVIEYQIPHIKLGKDMLFDIAEVESYLQHLTIASLNSDGGMDQIKTKQQSSKTLSQLNRSQNRYANLLGLS